MADRRSEELRPSDRLLVGPHLVNKLAAKVTQQDERMSICQSLWQSALVIVCLVGAVFGSAFCLFLLKGLVDDFCIEHCPKFICHEFVAGEFCEPWQFGSWQFMAVAALALGGPSALFYICQACCCRVAKGDARDEVQLTIIWEGNLPPPGTITVTERFGDHLTDPFVVPSGEEGREDGRAEALAGGGGDGGGARGGLGGRGAVRGGRGAR